LKLKNYCLGGESIPHTKKVSWVHAHIPSHTIKNTDRGTSNKTKTKKHMDIKEVQQPNSDGHYKQHQGRKVLNFVHQHLLSRMETINPWPKLGLQFQCSCSISEQMSDILKI
jgi:hypothetical protein